MKLYNKSAVILVGLLVLLCVLLASVYAQGKYKLKTGAKGEICLTCHVTFKETLKKKFIHTPLAEGDCTGCHSPHTSDHEGLMAADPNVICSTCHDDIAPAGAVSTHQVVAEGKCVLCHDPHASDHKMNLIKAGSALCFECHKNLGEQIADNKFPHAPVTKNCLTCHNPHASEAKAKLLTDEAPALCLKCHKTGKASFKRLHVNYPVEKADCSSCHNPHGSSTAAILYDNVHQPVSKKMCNQCHAEPTASAPFALKKSGFEVCQGCHYELMTDALNKKRVHWPLVDKTGCINCHAPHASKEPGLLKGSMLDICGSCHTDTLARQERSQTKHPPIADGECASCHEPHGSNDLFLMNQASILDVCSDCHEWQSHSTHPIGEEVMDPRNRNLTLQCASCHRTHGTEYKDFIYTEVTKDLCVLCHVQYRR
jgi:predicted CXXCH cytochrome family protein